MLKIAVAGASGRMGQSILALAASAPDVSVVGALVRPGSPAEGAEVPGWPRLAYTSDMDAALAEADVALDFSAPGAADSLAQVCQQRGCGLLVGTTGLNDDERRRLHAHAERIPLLLAPNTSLGVNLLLDLVRRAAQALGDEYDIEIIEAHHARKVDAPSGTALKLGEVAADARGVSLDRVADYGRHGQAGPRKRGDIGFSVVRGGDIAGEHTVMLAGAGERIELNHRATSRETFAGGAINAARWLAEQPAGLYDMSDVLGR